MIFLWFPIKMFSISQLLAILKQQSHNKMLYSKFIVQNQDILTLFTLMKLDIQFLSNTNQANQELTLLPKNELKKIMIYLFYKKELSKFTFLISFWNLNNASVITNAKNLLFVKYIWLLFGLEIWIKFLVLWVKNAALNCFLLTASFEYETFFFKNQRLRNCSNEIS